MQTRYYELLRALSAERRLQTSMGLTGAMRELAMAGIREQFPRASPHELQARLTVRLYGSKVAERLFGRVPEGAR